MQVVFQPTAVAPPMAFLTDGEPTATVPIGSIALDQTTGNPWVYTPLGWLPVGSRSIENGQSSNYEALGVASGALGVLAVEADNVSVLFDSTWRNSTFVAKSTTIGRVWKASGRIGFFYLGGQIADTAVSGTELEGLGINCTTGATTVSRGLIYNVQALTGAGAIDIVTPVTKFTANGAANALTLADGATGQVKVVQCISVSGGANTGVLTPTTKTGFSTITFDAIGDTVTLLFQATLGWMVVSNYNATIA